MPGTLLYNFPNADTLKEEFRLIKLDEDLSYTTEQAHRHNYFELFYFTRGGGSHLIDFTHFPIETKSLHVVPPGALHLLKRKSGSAGFVLLFTRAFLYSISDFTPAAHLHLWREKPVYRLTGDENAFVQLSLAQMSNEFENDRPYQHTVMTSLLHMLFILMYRQAPDKSIRGNDLTERFFDLLEVSFTSDHSTVEIASSLGCSLKTLNRALKMAGFKSAHHCIIERQLLEARRLLIHTIWSVKEIAFHLDFKDPDYFGKVFKAEVGESPTDYRERNS